MKVYLRAIEVSDHILINKWRNDEKVSRYLGSNHHFVSLEREKNWAMNKSVDDSNNLYLGICEIQTNKLVGYCNINNIDLRNRKAEWGGTMIGREYFGKGYGIQSAKLMLSYLFNQYPIHKCYASSLKEHPRTVKLFEELGFKKDGILRDEIFKDGRFWDVVLYSILRDEINGNF